MTDIWLICIEPIVIINFCYRSQGNISFNETGLCVTKASKENEQEPINVGLLKTPIHHKGRNGNIWEQNDDISPNTAKSGQASHLDMNTPMALKDISNRAQKELAMLYSPCIEEEETSPSSDNMDKDSYVRKQLW